MAHTFPAGTDLGLDTTCVFATILGMKAKEGTPHVVHPSWGVSVIFLSLPWEGLAPALCLCPMSYEDECQGLCPGPHREAEEWLALWNS